MALGNVSAHSETVGSHPDAVVAVLQPGKECLPISFFTEFQAVVVGCSSPEREARSAFDQRVFAAYKLFESVRADDSCKVSARELRLIGSRFC